MITPDRWFEAGIVLGFAIGIVFILLCEQWFGETVLPVKKEEEKSEERTE